MEIFTLIMSHMSPNTQADGSKNAFTNFIFLHTTEAFAKSTKATVQSAWKNKREIKFPKAAVMFGRDQWFQELSLKMSSQPLSLDAIKLDEGLSEWLDCGIIA